MIFGFCNNAKRFAASQSRIYVVVQEVLQYEADPLFIKLGAARSSINFLFCLSKFGAIRSKGIALSSISTLSIRNNDVASLYVSKLIDKIVNTFYLNDTFFVGCNLNSVNAIYVLN